MENFNKINKIVRYFLNETFGNVDEWKSPSLKNIRSYTDADEYLGGKKSRPIGNNTTLNRLDDNHIAVRHFNTNIVIFDSSEILTINTDGYHTNTTFARINALLPPNTSIGRRKGITYITAANGSIPFKDKMMVTADGNILY